MQKKLTFITTNKQQRKLKGLFKYKKRLANYGLNIHSKQYVFNTTGKPCFAIYTVSKNQAKKKRVSFIMRWLNKGARRRKFLRGIIVKFNIILMAVRYCQRPIDDFFKKAK